MSKTIAEDTSSLSIFWLKKHGYLDKDLSFKHGGITWTFGWSENKSSIGFCVIKENWGKPNESAQIQLTYTNINNHTQEKAYLDYNIELQTTACNYGGLRYWFKCPLYRNGIYCGKRVGVIYKAGKYFGCRMCANIAYDTQMRGGTFRYSVTVPDVEKQQEKIKRYYYNRKPTRQYKRLMKMEAKLERDMMASMEYILRKSKS